MKLQGRMLRDYLHAGSDGKGHLSQGRNGTEKQRRINSVLSWEKFTSTCRESEISLFVNRTADELLENKQGFGAFLSVLACNFQTHEDVSAIDGSKNPNLLLI